MPLNSLHQHHLSPIPIKPDLHRTVCASCVPLSGQEVSLWPEKQIVARGASTWLVRVYLGRDPQTGTRKYHNQTRRTPPSLRLKSSKQLSDQISKPEFQPSEYMRARRPKLFSDSRIESQALLGREPFEYHLETLTSSI